MTPSEKFRQGSASMAALLLTFLASAGVMALLNYASHSSRMTQRTLDYQRSRLVAEAGLDYGLAQLNDLIFAYQFSLSQSEMQDLLDDIDEPPALSGFEFKSPSGDVSFKITADTPPTTGPIPTGNVARGEEGQHQMFTITSGARNPETGVGAVLSQQVQATSLFIMRFGVFYWYDLEINPGPTMYFDGPIHTNHDAYLSGSLQIRAPITSHGAIYHDRKDSRNPSLGSVGIHDADEVVVYMKQDDTIIDSTLETWMTTSLGEWDGNVQSSSHGVPLLSPPINTLDDPYDIIRRPLSSSDPEYRVQTENEKFSNKAALYIEVATDGTLTATDFHGTDVTYKLKKAELKEVGTYDGNPLYEKDGNGKYAMDTVGAYTTDQEFTDGREGKTVAAVDIYVDGLMANFKEIATGSTYDVEEGRGVVYITREDPGGGKMPAVRIRNGQEMPSGGLTFATDLPLYVEGDYNTGDSREPTMVTADAVTFLSNNWKDAHSTKNAGDRDAVDTEFNTVVMTGNTETVKDGQYNGGLENVLRFLEDWGDDTVFFEGSIIDLWYSEIATSPWNGSYYTPPDRNWGFDPILTTKAPPGVTKVFGVEMLTWRVSSWEEHGWN